MSKSQLNKQDEIAMLKADLAEGRKEAVSFLDEVLPAMNVGNHNRSDLMTDYFDVGWYIDINIGRYNKPYVQT